jgi:O-antigen ligase
MLTAWDSVIVPIRRVEGNPKLLLWPLALLLVLVAQGAAISHSYVLAAPLLGLLVIAVAVDVPLVPVVGAALFARVLTDDLSTATSRYSSSLNPSALIAGFFILIAVGLVVRRRQSLTPAFLIGVWLAVWTAIAVISQGASAVVVREGVRELSIVAVGFIAYESRGALNLPTAVRIVQVVGLYSALLALYQLATHSGAMIGGFERAFGTFSHPNSAAVYFSIAAMASLWRYLDGGRNRLDAAFAGLYVAAVIATFSLGGFLGLLVMFAAFGIMRSGSRRLKIGVCVLVGLLVAAFLATPLGSERVESESSASTAASASPGEGSSLDWRFHRWQALIPEWEKAPLLGQGLGTKVSEEAPSPNSYTSRLPHSEYVRYLVETGVFGVAFLIAAVATLFRGLRRQRRGRDPGNAAAFGSALALGLLVNALAANTLLYTPAAYAAALILGAVLSSAAGLRRRSEPPRTLSFGARP